MMKSLFTLFLACMAFALSGQVSGNYMYNTSERWNDVGHQLQLAQPNGIAVSNLNQHQLILEINGLYNARASSYLAIFHVTQVGPDARTTDSLMNKRIDGVRKAALNAGLSEADFYVDMLSLVPLYEVEVTTRLFSKTYNEVPAGFEMQKNIHIRFTDAQVLDGLITAAAIEEIYDLVKVEYFVDDLAGIYAELRKQSLSVLDERIALFDSLGVAVRDQWTLAGETKSLHEPQAAYARYTSFTNTSVEAAKKKGHITQMKKPQTMYYSPLGYNGFDLVANPEILEPVIQFTYKLTVQLELKRPEPLPIPEPEVRVENRHKYFLLNPKGDEIKTFELHE